MNTVTKNVTENTTRKRGRPRLYPNDTPKELSALRSRAYRERVKRRKDKEFRKEVRKEMRKQARENPMSVEIGEDTLKSFQDAARAQRENTQYDAQRQRAEAEKDQRAIQDEIIDAGMKALAMKHHPDRGGSTEDMQRVNAAVERLRRMNSQMN
ncbi:MAG: hypothetical protein LAO78_23765 [Acidobacteriia bacterium]|nr:hypothetical protein [Terriglobia bacterium]